MAHKKNIGSVKKQGQVTIKDLDKFLSFTLCNHDMRAIHDTYIEYILVIPNKAFELDVCKRSDDDCSLLFLNWYPSKDVFGRQFDMKLCDYDSSNHDDDPALDIVMTQSQYDAFLLRFEEQYKKAYGVTIERDWKNSLSDNGEDEEKKIGY